MSWKQKAFSPRINHKVDLKPEVKKKLVGNNKWQVLTGNKMFKKYADQIRKTTLVLEILESDLTSLTG